MKASELRINNYLYNDGVVVKIDARTIFDIWDDKGLKNYKPIPLTEEWMLKFGFKKLSHNNIWQKITNANRVLNLEEADGYIKNAVGFGVSEDGYRMIQIYVHQIQNLYFALTNEELTYEQQK